MSKTANEVQNTIDKTCRENSSPVEIRAKINEILEQYAQQVSTDFVKNHLDYWRRRTFVEAKEVLTHIDKIFNEWKSKQEENNG